MIRKARRIHSTAGPAFVIALLLLPQLSFPGAAQEVGGTTLFDPFRPDTVLAPPGGPRIVREIRQEHEQGAGHLAECRHPLARPRTASGSGQHAVGEGSTQR